MSEKGSVIYLNENLTQYKTVHSHWIFVRVCLCACTHTHTRARTHRDGGGGWWGDVCVCQQAHQGNVAPAGLEEPVGWLQRASWEQNNYSSHFTMAVSGRGGRPAGGPARYWWEFRFLLVSQDIWPSSPRRSRLFILPPFIQTHWALVWHVTFCTDVLVYVYAYSIYICTHTHTLFSTFLK